MLYRNIGVLLWTFILSGAAQEPLADLRLREYNGPERGLEEYRGKIVILNFWATWCEPCRDEMPLFVAAHARYGESGVIVIGASADDESTQARIPGFQRKMRIGFPIWVGATTEHMERLGLGTGLPATAFIGRGGEIVSRVLGPVTREELELRIEYLLGVPGARVPEPLLDKITVELQKHSREESIRTGRRVTRVGYLLGPVSSWGQTSCTAPAAGVGGRRTR